MRKLPINGSHERNFSTHFTISRHQDIGPPVSGLSANISRIFFPVPVTLSSMAVLFSKTFLSLPAISIVLSGQSCGAFCTCCSNSSTVFAGNFFSISIRFCGSERNQERVSGSLGTPFDRGLFFARSSITRPNFCAIWFFTLSSIEALLSRRFVTFERDSFHPCVSSDIASIFPLGSDMTHPSQPFVRFPTVLNVFVRSVKIVLKSEIFIPPSAS